MPGGVPHERCIHRGHRARREAFGVAPLARARLVDPIGGGQRTMSSRHAPLLRRILVTPTRHVALQLFRYFWVAFIAAGLDTGIYALLTLMLGVHHLTAGALGFIAGLVANYLLARAYVFSVERHRKSVEFTLYAIIGLVVVLLAFFVINFIAFSTGVDCIRMIGFDKCA